MRGSPINIVCPNRVVAEVPQFIVLNFHGKMWPTYDNIWQTLATYDKKRKHVCTYNTLLQDVTNVRPSCENLVCPDPRLE